jgi:hypothetical protein
MRTPYEDRKLITGDITKLIPADVSNKLQATAETTRIEPEFVVIEFRQEPFPPHSRAKLK